MPERLAAQLAEINNLGTSERVHAERFMTTLRTQLEDHPEYGNNEAVRDQIAIFEENIQNIDEAWARAQLDVLATTRREIDALRPSETREFSDDTLRELVEYTLGQEADGDITPSGDREVYLFQYYFNQTDISGNIGVDGDPGPETRRTITNNVQAVQIFLHYFERQENGSSDILITRELDEQTVNAVREHFGIDIVATAVELAEETVEDLANLSISELVTRLEAATTTRDRGSYNALLANKFTDEGYIITLGAGNDFQILNGESPVNLEISAENLGAIMVLMSMDQADIDNDVLDENIPNNIFDGVVRRYEFRNTNDNELWTAQDFIVDAVRTTSEVEANKTTCIGQIDAKIVELRNELEADGLNENQKSEIRRLIQKLEVAKIFVRDQNIFSRDSLVIAQYVGETHRDIAHLLGTTADAQRRRGGTPGIGDIRDFAISQIPTAILAGFFMLLAKLLPSPLEEAMMAFVGGIAALSVAEDMQERGWVGDGRGDPAGTNRPDVTSGSPSEMADWMRVILTDAPNGLEQRHEAIYARMVRQNTEGGYFERPKLDTMYLLLSQDPTFGAHNLENPAGENILDDISSEDAWALISPSTQSILESQGITQTNILHFVNLLKSEHGDTEDNTIADMFVVGQITETSNNLNITWVNGDRFADQNRDINRALVQISGASLGIAESLRENSTRARVEEAISIAQPNYAQWIAASVLDRVNLELDDTTIPSLENINQVMTNLDTLLADSNISADDKTFITTIREQYESIKNSLERTQRVDTYIAEAASIYTFLGSVGRTFDSTIIWIQGWGNTVPLNPAEPITVEGINDMITRGEELIGEYPDEAERINTVINDLRLYQINMLDDAARVASLTPAERAELTRQSDETLSAIITANPEAYMQTLRNIDTELSELKNTYIDTAGYLAALSGNISELVTLQRLARLTTGNTEFNTLADRIYTEVYTSGIEANLRAHLAAKVTEMTTFSTAATTLDEVEARQTAFNTLRDELLINDWGTDIMNFFGIADEYRTEVNEVNYIIVPDAVDRIFTQINSGYTSISFDESIVQDKQREIDEARNSFARDFEVQISPLSDVINVSEVGRYKDEVIALVQAISELPEDVQEIKMNELRVLVRDTIESFTTQLGTYNASQVDEINALSENYSMFISNRAETDEGNIIIGNAGNGSFEQVLVRKQREIETAEHERLLRETIVGNLESNTLIFITRFREQYQGRYSVLDSELELLTDSSATIQDVLDTLDILGGWSLADNNGDGNSDDFGSLEAGAEAFDDTALQAFTTAAETTKTSLQGAFSQNDVRNFMTRTYGGMMNTLQELGLI